MWVTARGKKVSHLFKKCGTELRTFFINIINADHFVDANEMDCYITCFVKYNNYMYTQN